LGIACNAHSISVSVGGVLECVFGDLPLVTDWIAGDSTLAGWIAGDSTLIAFNSLYFCDCCDIIELRMIVVERTPCQSAFFLGYFGVVVGGKVCVHRINDSKSTNAIRAGIPENFPLRRFLWTAL
jgi:hypothetical protein